MIRTGIAGMVLGLIAMSAGCRMCAHPYDYCGPTFLGRGTCCSDGTRGRAGSIMNAGATPVAEVAPGTEEAGPAPESPTGIPVSDQTANANEDSGAVAMATEVAASPQVVEESRGWVSQRRGTRFRSDR